MRAQDLETLELPGLLEVVGGFASSAPGREACHQLAPRLDLAEIEEEFALLTDFTSAIATERPPLGDFPDIRALLAIARTPGTRLPGSQLREIASVIGVMRAIRGHLRSASIDRPRLHDLLLTLHAFPELDRLLADALDEDGNLRDEASPALRAVRREIRRLRADLEQRLGRLSRRTDGARVVSDEYVTLRNGRYVVPVRPASAGELPGIVQDRSASGETWFVEPLFAVEDNNRLILAQRAETEEELRVLADLTARVGDQAALLHEAFSTLVRIDTLHARVEFARRYDATCPRIGAREIRLRGARHPLLVATGRPVVPVDIELAEEERLLLVTGPNTGGKSVALKTLGLAVLAAQSGVPVTADPGALLPCFHTVLTDVGDRQTVSGDLSTFSGHVVNLREILTSSGPAALVLLDEPGASTDPDDGAALAHALLEALVDRGARVLATTHFPSVKARALSDRRTKVASVDFDPETFAPRYRLIYGSVGPSLGLQIARRLGLPAEILERARRDRDGAGPDLAAAVDRLEQERRRYEDREAATAAEERRLSRLRAEQETLVADLRQKRARRWEEELAGARRFALELRDSGQRLLDDEKADRAERARAMRTTARDQLARIEAARRAALRGEDAGSAGRVEGNEDGATPATGSPVAVGDLVEVVGSGLRGQVAAFQGDRARVVQGGLRFDVPVQQLCRVGRAAGESPAGRGRAAPTPSRRTRGSTGARQEASEPATVRDTPALPGAEISLLGERVQNGLVALEAFLDRAVLEDVESVRIIHGAGTGALRDAVRRYLADSAYVANFRPGEPHEGGTGVTVARLR